MSATLDHRAPLASLAPGSRAALIRRRLAAVAVLVTVAFLLTVAIGRVGAQAELADPVAGHVTVQPGGSLWSVAADSAPDGVDPRAQLEAIRELNGIDGSDVAAWTVILLPVR